MLVTIRRQLSSNADPEYKKGGVNFFKEPIKLYGVRTPVVRKICAANFAAVKHLRKEEIFKRCEDLLKSNYHEEAIIAFDWARRINKLYAVSDFKIFEKWLNSYVTNWAMDDDFCAHAFGLLIIKYPRLLKSTKFWLTSKNRWLRRASAVIMIPLIRHDKKYIGEIPKIADALLLDPDDLAQKGYGWMLKVASEHDQKMVFDFIMKRKNIMPRTALRYAIEKMPAKMKKQAMSNNTSNR
ncbi:MAG: DNA alkylation repair protein [Patescibacteria group bacterium]